MKEFARSMIRFVIVPSLPIISLKCDTGLFLPICQSDQTIEGRKDTSAREIQLVPPKRPSELSEFIKMDNLICAWDIYYPVNQTIWLF